MKQITLLLAPFLFSVMLQAQQTVITFKPSAGANDGSDQGGMTSGKDAFIYEGDPALNYGSNPSMVALPISNCNSTHAVAYIQFDVSSLPSTVDSVVFGVTHPDHTNYCLSNCNADFYFARITSAWDEMTVNYQSPPSTDTAFYGPINISFPNSFGTREYNITSTYLLWKNGTVPNNGFSIYSTTVGCNNAAVYFGSSTSDDTTVALRPYLKVYTSASGIEIPLASKLGFSISPTPAQDVAHVHFTLPQNGTAVFRLTDVSGRAVTEPVRIESSGEQNLTIDLSFLRKGMYFYTLETTEGNLSGKLLHQGL